MLMTETDVDSQLSIGNGEKPKIVRPTEEDFQRLREILGKEVTVIFRSFFRFQDEEGIHWHLLRTTTYHLVLKNFEESDLEIDLLDDGTQPIIDWFINEYEQPIEVETSLKTPKNPDGIWQATGIRYLEIIICNHQVVYKAQVTRQAP
jgi:hypothetical protein